jgi:glutathione S-transferase
MPSTLKLYHTTGSPNSRRVRIFITEKGLALTLVPVDLGKGEQHTDEYRAINPRRMVPTLVLEDGTAIGEVPALVERSKLRVANFFSDLDARLADAPFVAGDQFSVADITALVTTDFATKAFATLIPEEHRALTRWYEGVSVRPSISA